MPKNKKINWAIYARLLSYVKPYKGRLIMGIFFGLITGGSIFGLLTQAATVMDSVVGDSKTQSASQYTVINADTILGETSGIEFSPDKTRIYVAYQTAGKIFEILPVSRRPSACQQASAGQDP